LKSTPISIAAASTTPIRKRLLVLRVHVLVHEDQDDEREEGDHRDDRAELILNEEPRRIVLTADRACWRPSTSGCRQLNSDDHQKSDQ
jgi:hypothetical protein